MKKAALLMFLTLVWTTGFAQNLSFKFGTAFKRADLDVRWKVPSNAFPENVWVYRFLPNRFFPQLISAIATLCDFTEKDIIRKDADWLVFETPDHSRRLGFFFPIGSIEYQTPEVYNPKNLVKGVPSESELRHRTPDVLKKFGIGMSDIDRQENSEVPDIHVFDSEIMFFTNHVTITNTVYRGIRFRRRVDGASFTGAGTGGDCEIRFGDHDKVVKISATWRNTEHYKKYACASPETLIHSIRQGYAVQNMLPTDATINWKTVKSVTISKAQLCCYAGGPFDPSPWLIPFAALWATVDTGHGSLDVEIDCPLVDPAKPLKAEGKE